MESTGLVGIFVTGLLTGGLTCMAVQGGLLATSIAQREEDHLKEQVKLGGVFPILAFLVAKLISYTILGFFLGMLGSAFQLSLTATIIMQIAISVFMIGTALNILNVHPIFRYFVIQPPHFLTRWIRKRSKSADIFAPAILGLLTVFLPCGTTQAMMALAIGSGNPLYGAAILFSFVLGTSPVFFLLGYFATKLGDRLNTQFMKIASYAIILLAVFNINNAVALSGSKYTLESMFSGFWCTVSVCSAPSVTTDAGSAVEEASIEIQANGYSPNVITVKAGSQVTLHLTNNSGYGCVQAFTIPSLNIQKVVAPGSGSDITFQVPANPGDIPFMCSMGMYRGIIHAI